MSCYDLQFLVNTARTYSPFYKNLYANIGHEFILSELPIIDPLAYEQAMLPTNNQILAGPMAGIALKSGASTGDPKQTIYSKAEWRFFAAITADLQHRYQLIKGGDRIIYTLGAGGLYGGMFLGYEIQMHSQSDVLILLVGNNVEQDFLIKTIREYNANVLFATPKRLVSLTNVVNESKLTDIKLDTLFWCGDLIQKEQYDIIRSVFPHAIFCGHLYASTDAGFIGFSDQNCGRNEFREYGQYAEVEIIDDEGNIIEEENREGNVVSTNFTRILMPVIRYPTGDLAMWIEPKEALNRKFKLTGRSIFKERIISLGDGITLDYNIIRNIINRSKVVNHVDVFQILISREEGRDLFKIKYTAENHDVERFKQEITQALYSYYPALKQAIDTHCIHPIEIKNVNYLNLEYLPLTGKVARIRDLREG